MLGIKTFAKRLTRDELNMIGRDVPYNADTS